MHVQYAVAFICALHAANQTISNTEFKYRANEALRKRCGDVPLRRCHWQSGCVDFAPRVRICTCAAWNFEMARDCLRGHAPGDIVVYGSIALDWRELKSEPHAQSAEWMATFARREARTVLGALARPGAGHSGASGHGGGVHLLWREATAQHFAARGGHYVGRDNYNLLNATSACVAHPAAEMEAEQRWNPAANAAMADAGVPVLRVWAATQQAHAFHIGFGDCTHWCQLRGGVPELLLPPLVEALLRLPFQPTTDPGVGDLRTPRNRVLDSAGHLGAKIGYCDATVLGEGSLCAPSHHKGSWKVKTMAECVRLCLGCPQCRFVTRYAPLNECSWFSRCPGFPDRLRRPDRSQSQCHRTRLVRFHNGSVASHDHLAILRLLLQHSANPDLQDINGTRAPATPPPLWAGARFAAMSCGSSDMLTEDQWLQFYRANSGWAAMTVVTTADDDPCPFCAWTHLTLPRRGQPWGHWELHAQAKAWRSHLVTVLADYYVYLRPDMAWLVPVQRLLVQLRPDGRSLIYVPNHAYGASPTPEWSNGTKQINDRVAIATRTAAASFFNRAHRLDADLSRFSAVVSEMLLGREMVERRVAIHTFPVLAVVRCCMNPALCADRRALSGKATKCHTLTATASEGDGTPLEVKYQYEAFAAATYAEALLRSGAQLDTCDRGFCLRPRVRLSWDRIGTRF